MHLTGRDLDSCPSVRLNSSWKEGWGGTSVPSVTMENPRPFSFSITQTWNLIWPVPDRFSDGLIFCRWSGSQDAEMTESEQPFHQEAPMLMGWPLRALQVSDMTHCRTAWHEGCWSSYGYSRRLPRTLPPSSGAMRPWFKSPECYSQLPTPRPKSSAVHSPLRPMTFVQGFELWSLYCLAQIHLLLSLPAPVLLETRGKSFCLSHIQHKLHWHHDKCRLAVRKETTSLETAPTAQTGRSYQEVTTDKF